MENVENALKKYENAGFVRYEMEEIKKGFENGLTVEQVAFYAREEFKFHKMREIRKGFENGLTMEQVKLYAREEFEASQMEEIRLGFQDGLSMEQVAFYARKEFDSYQMDMVRCALKIGLNFEQTEFFTKDDFDDSQMEEISKGFQDGLSLEQVKMYAKEEFPYWKMKVIRLGLKNNFTMEQIENYCEKEIWKCSKKDIEEASQKLSQYGYDNLDEFDKMICDIDFSMTYHQALTNFEIIDFCLKNNVSLEKTKPYLKKSFFDKPSDNLFCTFYPGAGKNSGYLYAVDGIHYGLTLDQIKFCIKEEFSRDRVLKLGEQLIQGIEMFGDGESIEKLEIATKKIEDENIANAKKEARKEKIASLFDKYDSVNSHYKKTVEKTSKDFDLIYKKVCQEFGEWFAPIITKLNCNKIVLNEGVTRFVFDCNNQAIDVSINKQELKPIEKNVEKIKFVDNIANNLDQVVDYVFDKVEEDVDKQISQKEQSLKEEQEITSLLNKSMEYLGLDNKER